jgi:hypothetical protein
MDLLELTIEPPADEPGPAATPAIDHDDPSAAVAVYLLGLSPLRPLPEENWYSLGLYCPSASRIEGEHQGPDDGQDGSLILGRGDGTFLLTGPGRRPKRSKETR